MIMSRMFTPLGKHPIVDPDLLLETSQDGKYLCCLSERDVFIIRSCVFPYQNWPTRYARPRKGLRWELSTGEEFVSFQEDLDKLDSDIIGGDFMTCLEQGLSEIAQALRYMADHNCCSDTNISIDGGVVATYTDPDGIDTAIYGSHPPATVEEGIPPDGFETWEEYLLNKCQVANLVFDGWITTLGGLSLLTVFNATVLGGLIGLAFAGVISFPPAAIPIMIAALIALGVEVAVLHSIADELNSNKADIVCQLYTSSTVESMVAILADAVDAAIATLELTGPIGSAAKTVALLLVNSDTLSQLISGIAGISYPDADCSACGCPSFTYTFAPGQPTWDTTTEPTWEGVRPSNQSFTLASERMQWAGAGSATTSWVSVSWEQVLEDMGVLPFTGSIDISMGADSSGLLDFYILGEYPGGVFYIMDPADTLNGPATKSISNWNIHDAITDTDIIRIWVMVDGTADGWIDDVTIGKSC